MHNNYIDSQVKQIVSFGVLAPEPYIDGGRTSDAGTYVNRHLLVAAAVVPDVISVESSHQGFVIRNGA